MSLTLFGTTAAVLRSRYFPQIDAFSVLSSPTAVVVGDIINACAATLDGKLRQEDITPAAITDTTSAAYYWCAETILLASAIKVMQASTHQDPKVLEAWRDELKERYADLAKSGAAALGDGVSLPATEVDGPLTHIDEHSLDVADETLMSTAEPVFRKDDEL